MWIYFHKLTKTSITRRQTLPKGHLNKKKTQSIFTSHALAFQYSTFETASPSGLYPIHLHNSIHSHSFSFKNERIGLCKSQNNEKRMCVYGRTERQTDGPTDHSRAPAEQSP